MLALAALLALQSPREDLRFHLGNLHWGTAWQQVAGASAGVDELAARLPDDAKALVFFEGVRRWLPGASEPESLLVAILSKDAPPEIIELGVREAIEGAVRRWRAAIGKPLWVYPEARLVEADRVSVGAELRELTLDAALARCGDVRQLFVFAGAGLELMPLDALPYGDGLLGDRWTIETIGWLSDLPPREIDPYFLLVCGIDYGDGGPDPRTWSPIPLDIRELLATVDAFGKLDPQGVTILRGDGAAKSAVLGALPLARFAHLSTHGWSDESGSTAAGARSAAPVAGSARGIRPLALCGTALAGINRGADASGVHPGVLTGAELADVDLTGCELFVLEADRSSVGTSRAGQAGATLANAAHRAGARQVVASLWDVDRRVSPRLFARFYAELWRERELPARALWKAKRAVAAEGAPMESWAGWTMSAALR